MKKKIISVMLCCAVLMQCVSCFAQGTEKEISSSDNELFSTVSIVFPEGDEYFTDNYEKSSSTFLRYSDDKTPIALSAYYDGYVFGTVPKENENRPVEYFFAEEKFFSDEPNDEDGYTEDTYHYYIMKELAKRGVVAGDDKGRANPNENITRAEAVAMILRLMGVEKLDAPESGFSDVAPDSWYAPYVAKAKQMGIVSGDSPTLFSPERHVSRQETVAMAARAVWCTGFARENKNATVEDVLTDVEVGDAKKLPSWAYSAYATMKFSVPYDMVESDKLDAEGVPISIFYLNPQSDATRFQMAEMLLRICENFQVYPSQIAKQYGFDKKMPVMDGSTSTYPFTQSIYTQLFFNGYNHKDKPLKHSKSHATYEKLIDGKIDMMIASVYPAEDILALAKEKNVELELIPIAYDAMVFFTNAQNSSSNLTMQQITDIYVDNKYTNWNEIGGEDALLYPYARNYDSGSHAQMERHFLKGKDINDKIRQETTSISMANVLTDVMGAMTENPKGYGLGYSIYYYFNNMDLFYDTKTNLKLLSVDGVLPSDETIANGTYPLSNNTYIVLRKDEPKDSPARKMAEFMLTEGGQQCVADAGFGPLIKK